MLQAASCKLSGMRGTAHQPVGAAPRGESQEHRKARIFAPGRGSYTNPAGACLPCRSRASRRIV